MSASTKPRCVKISQRWDSVLIGTSVSSPTGKTSYTEQAQHQRRLTEQKSANHSGNRAHAVTASDASSFTITTKTTAKAITCKRLVFYCWEDPVQVKADSPASSRRKLTERNTTLTIIYSFFFIHLTLPIDENEFASLC